MNPIPAWTQRLWHVWDIRVLILGSLTLQVILIILGSRRRHVRGIWIEIMVWSAYIMADWVAPVALGKLSDATNPGNSGERNNDPNNVLTALWAPLLLLHLGGPDTITAYSIQDAQLWMRHFLGLVVQAVLAVYVILSCWTASWLSILTIPLLIAGIIKYGERTWVLWSANNEDPRDTKSMEDYAAALDLIRDIPGVKMIVVSYFWLQALAPYLANYGGNFGESERVARMSAEFEIGEEIFQLIEFVLGFIYDVLYTKAAIIYTRLGFILRSVSFMCLVAVLLGFSIIAKDEYSSVNVVITYLLLGGAVVLEVYAASIAICSNWGIVRMIKHCRKPHVTRLIQILAPQTLKYGKRWSNSVAQFNLINFSLYDEKLKMLNGILRLFRLDERFKKFRCTNYFDGLKAENGLKLKDLKQQISEGVESINEKLWEFETFTHRGELALERNQCKDNLGWSTNQKDLDQSIIAWHIATDICYYLDDNPPTDARIKSRKEASKVVSDYMMHLLVNHPYMLRIKGGNVALENTRDHLLGRFKEKGSFRDDKQEQCKMLLEEEYDHDDSTAIHGWPAPRSALVLARILAKRLLNYPVNNRWNIINSVWVEMLCHGASHCQVNYHAQQLTRGGELLTHVWLLLTIYGFTEKVNQAGSTLRKIFTEKSIAATRVR